MPRFDYWTTMFGEMSEGEVAEATFLSGMTPADAEAAVEAALDKAEQEASDQGLGDGDEGEMAHGRETARREILAAWARRPAARFGLTEIHRMEVNGDQWVLYSDGECRDIVPAEQFDRPTTLSDYSEWCSGTSSGDEETLIRVLRDLGGPTQTVNSGAHGGLDAGMFIAGDFVVAGEGEELDYGRIDREEGGYTVAWLDSLTRSPVVGFRALQKMLEGGCRFDSEGAAAAYGEAFAAHADAVWVAEEPAAAE